ncbi:Hypothetical protein SRAE_X000221600 [Strongyloides ratti]|uniref:BZIP domain-containing protein n=1 Tax=Strongyloides ratti TaxID=34506 RepID=A0A090KX77_STRRB|nr:Hypothetical protein SRAE_X000221600 [Strongyloides ratti]CEF60477.1 Hypothetical protein SRAE_X000221600 [Strongyloides ratti]
MNYLSSFTLFILLILLFCFKSLEISDKNLIDSLNIENVPVPVALNDEEDNHIIQKRQRRSRRQRRARRNRRALIASINVITVQLATLGQQLSSLQAQVSNLATTTTTAAPTAGR